MPRLVKRRVRTEAPHAPSQDEQVARIFQQILAEAGELEDKHLRDLWCDAVQTYINSGDIAALIDVTKWRRPVVDLETFLHDPAYLGIKESEIYPGLIEMLHALDTDQYDEVVMKGALGIGKTTGANYGTLRDLYKLSCMRNPQQVYGIGSNTPIVFTIQSVRLATAKKVVFGELGRLCRASPYFRNKFMFDQLISSELIFHEHNIRVMPVSSSGTAVISMNVIGGQLDEANFLQKTIHSKSQNADESGGFDQAKLLYNTLAARRKSRFTHRQGLPGALYLISSSRFPDDFTELKAQEAEMYGGKDKRIYVFEGSQWSIKGRDKFRAEEFQVQIGNESFPSRVLTNGAVANPGCQVINVPMDFLEDFERDTEGSIRDLAGLTTLATHPFITQRHKIAEAMELATDKGYLNPLGLEQVCFADGLPKPNLHRLRTDVDAPRHAHIDLGISKDACGIAIGHIAGHMVKETVNEETGKRDTEITPVVAYDIVLRVVPPLGGEIQLEDVRTFLNRLKKIYGLNIKTVTFDGFQSVDSRQLLRKQGFMADYLSVEKPEPWRSFRDALYDGRILLFRHNWVSKELAEVETTLTQARKEKIDHRPNGTKDVADAVVGVAAYLLSRRVSWRSVQYDGGATGMFLLGDRAMKEIMANGMGRPNKGTIEETGRRSIQRRSIARRSMR